MFKNTAGQKLTVFAFDATSTLPKSGDAANITAYRDLDDAGVTVLADTTATEKDATNAKGYYAFDLAQAETNGDKILFSAKSSTANVVVIAVPAVVYTLPANLTSTTLANLDAAMTSRSTYAGGPVASVTAGVNVTQVNGVSITPVTLVGGNVPSVVQAVGAGAITSAGFTVGTVSGRPAGLLERLMQVWRHLYGPEDKNVGTGHIRTLADDGTTVLTTNAWTDDGAGNETLGISS